METQQKATKFDASKDLYIDYLAAGQIDENGMKISREKFAQMIDVNPVTLYRWQNDIPDFWHKVAKRSNSLAKRKAPKVMNALYVQALKGNVQAAKLILQQAQTLEAEKAEINTTHKGEISFVNEVPTK